MAIFGSKKESETDVKKETTPLEEPDALMQRLQAAEKQAIILARQLKESERIRELAEADNLKLAAERAQSDRKAALVRGELTTVRQQYAHVQETLVDKHLAMSELREALIAKQEQLDELLHGLASAPVMTEQTQRLFQLQQDVLDNLQNTLVCAMCFEGIRKGEIISLACGHVFCTPCIEKWAVASVTNQMHSLPDALKGPVRAECPECRGDASRSGRIKVFVLEEIVRVLARYDPHSVLQQASASQSSADAIEVDL